MLLTTRQTCICGRSFNVPGELSRTTVLCPTCTRPLFVPENEPAPTKPLSTNPFKATYEPKGVMLVDWQVGDVYLDIYEVRALIGEGGMGKVFRVYHRLWDLEIAVKCPSPKLLAHLGGIDYFEQECNTWVNLGLHPHLATCYYVRRVGGVPRIFAEYVESGDVLDWINNGRLYSGGREEALSRMLCVSLQCAWALSYAHDQEIIHRDIKPSNILLTAEGVAKVTDFGLAKSLQSAARGNRHETSARFSGLTPAYCAPEQLRGGETSVRSDLWSWAVTVLHMFTGRIVWPSGPEASQVLSDKKALLEGHDSVPALPEPVRDLLHSCLQDNPDRRPESMSWVADSLEGIHESILGEPCPCARPTQAIPRAENLNNGAVSLQDLGNTEQAEFRWQEALDLSPNHPESSLNLALQRWRTGRITDEDVLDLIRNSSEDAAIRSEMLAEIHLERGDCESALVLLEADRPASPLISVANDCLQSSRRACVSLQPHVDAINGLGVSDSEKLVASISTDNTIRLSTLQTGEELRTLAGHSSAIDQLWVSDDFGTIVTGALDRTVRLWDGRTGNCLWVGRADWERVRAVALGNEGASILVATDENQLYSFDVSSGQLNRVVHGPNGWVVLILLSVDGRRAVSAQDDGCLHVWRTDNGHVEFSWNVPSTAVTCLAMDRSGRYVAAGGAEGHVYCWSLGSDETPRVFAGHKGVVNAVAFSEDCSRIVSAGEDGTCRLWEVSNGRCLCTLSGDGAPVRAAAITRDGEMAVSGDRFGGMTIWEIHADVVYRSAPLRLSRSVSMEVSAKQESVFRESVKHASTLLDSGDIPAAIDELVRLRGDDDVGSRREALALWTRLYRVCRKKRLRGHWRIATLRGHGGPVRRTVWSSDNSSLFGIDDAGFLHRWNVATGASDYRIQAHTGPALDLSLCEASGRIITGGHDRMIRCWDSETGESIRTMEGHAAPVTSAQVSPCGTFVLSTAWAVRLWNLASGRLLGSLENSKIDVRTVRWLPDGHSFLTAGGEKVQVWCANTMKCNETFDLRPHMVENVEVAPDGQFVVIGSNRLARLGTSVHVWDLNTGQLARFTETESGRIREIDIAADAEHWVIVYESGISRFYSITGGECGDEFRALHGDACAAAVTQDGAMLAVGGSDGSIEIWGLDWEVVFEKPRDWEKRIGPYLECVLLSQIRSLGSRTNPVARLSGLLRKFTALPSGFDHARVKDALGFAGYGWLEPQDVERATRNCLTHLNAGPTGLHRRRR